MSWAYPFSAIVGQEELQTALLLCAINPKLGGVLVRGDKGTAKSTAARALAHIMLPIEKMAGCNFNCLPGVPASVCDVCSADNTTAQLEPVPFITLPLGATEDRLIGSLDFEKALKSGCKSFQPGLLASAHRGILYVDEVNLLPDHLIDVLLDAVAMAMNSVQREGISISHPAQFALIGTMNPEEGELRPQLLDRFALMVEVTAPADPAIRAQVVRQRMAFEASPQSFIEACASAEAALTTRINKARQLLPLITIDDALLLFISQLCSEMGIVSLRADIVMAKAASTLAALDGRNHVNRDDIQLAAKFALPHRRRKNPHDRVGFDQSQLEQIMKNAPDAKTNMKPNTDQTGHEDDNDGGAHGSSNNDDNNHDGDDDDRNDSDENGDDDDRNDSDENDNVTGSDMEGQQRKSDSIFSAAPILPANRLQVNSSGLYALSGRRATGIGTAQGQYVSSVSNAAAASIAVDATIRHTINRTGGRLEVERSDLQEKVRASKTGTLVLFLIDSSGSMAALKRMEAVKGCVISLLQDSYEKRDKVGVICFRGDHAELILPPTRNVELAKEKLATLPTGGQTPLADGLGLASEILKHERIKENCSVLLVVITDGRANVAEDGKDPWQDALNIAAQIAQLDVTSLVLDTESGYVRLGRTHALAEALGGDCIALDRWNSEPLTLAIRRTRTRRN